MDKASMTLGWLVGRQIAGQRKAVEKQPIAYLFNGVQLPPLPDWDKETYPYAVIHSAVSGGGYYLYLHSDTPSVHVESSAGELWYGTPNATTISMHVYPSFETEWKYQLTYGGASAMLKQVVWANHDILNSDGSVYLSASDPIPVYE